MLAAVALVVALTALAVERETASSSRRPWAAAWPCCPWPPGAAILRYRLDDLDRISRRTLAWALLMVLLGLG